MLLYLAMSCPYFDPLERRSSADDRLNAMLPLGGVWAGVCRAVRDQPWEPDAASLVPLCNLGYARGGCPRFPGENHPDAVRFAVRSDDGVRLRVLYVIERDHLPFAHGALEYLLADGSFLEASAGESVARQACAYIESYLRRKTEALAGATASQH